MINVNRLWNFKKKGKYYVCVCVNNIWLFYWIVNGEVMLKCNVRMSIFFEDYVIKLEI